MKLFLYAAGLAAACLVPTGPIYAAVSINEIMYHPAAGQTREQFIELRNDSPLAVNLNSWRLSGAIDFQFNNASIAGYGFLVVVADREAFSQRYPAVVNYTGNWSGILDGRGTIRLRDAEDNPTDSISYDSEGDWSVRRLALNLSYLGWEWLAPHDGGGSSLELINPLISHEAGQNWDASTVTNGTPGLPNSIARTNSAPLIQDVVHHPIVPTPEDTVTVVARVSDEPSSLPPTVTLYWRVDANPALAFQAKPMVDSGLVGDGAPGDGTFGAILPAQPLRAIVEYYILATDTSGNSRTYPRTVPEGTRTANLLYQVDPDPPIGKKPLYRVILTTAEKAALDTVNRVQPTSDASSSGAFIAQDGGSVVIRQQVGFRNRGHGTRTRNPHNIKVSLPGDQPWNGRSGVNLNSAYPFVQMVGSALMRQIGLVIPESRLVTVRVNATNSAVGSQYGSYAANWETDSDLLRAHIPLNPGGNLYRGIRGRDFAPGTGTANLVWHGDDYHAYTNAYYKGNHVIENDWTDLLDLIAVLNSTNTHAASTYVTDVPARLDVTQWMRYFASQTILDNKETNLADGYGDDYSLYSGLSDPRFIVLPYDLDTILGQGDTAGNVNDDLFRMAIPGVGNSVPAVDRLIKTPEFVRIYYGQLRELCQGLLSGPVTASLLDRLLTESGVPNSTIEAMKTFSAARTAYILSQIPTTLSVTLDLPFKNDYRFATSSVVSIAGRSDPVRTHQILVAGVPANWINWQARWTSTNVNLSPGLNRVPITAIGEGGVELERLVQEIWFDDGNTSTAPLVIAGNTTWTAAGGPYLLNADLAIATGATLSIESGTSIFLGNNARIVVANGGRLLAEGTPGAPINFSQAPGGTAWSGLIINGGPNSPESRLRHVHFEGNSTTCIEVADGTLWLDHATFGNTTRQYLSLDRASFRVTDCVFPSATALFELVHGTGGIKAGGQGIIQRCLFGVPIAYNDAMDFTGGNRELGQLIIQYYNNVFLGGSDDLLDLDGTDAWIEGNIFLHCHVNGAPDSASAISGGSDGPRTSEVTAIGNLFYDCDQMATAKEGDFFALLYNTVVRVTREGGTDSAAGVVNVRDLPFGGQPTAFGRGFYLEGNVITDVEQLVRNADPAQAPVVFRYNLLPLAWNGPGTGNIIATDPQLRHQPSLAETQFTNWASAQVMWDWFGLQPGSPARLASVDGADLGGVRSLGVQLAGVPIGVTRDRNAAIRVGPNHQGDGIPTASWSSGAGYTHYRWRLDAGIWSAESSIQSPITLADLAPGSHRLEVSGRRDSGIYQDDPILGEDAGTTLSAVWTVIPTLPPIQPIQRLRLNELLADNASVSVEAGDFPDLIELYNPNDTALSLAGVGLTTDSRNPFRFRFPPGSSIAGQGFLVLLAKDAASPGGIHPSVGFKLDRTGESLFLYSATTNLLDAVRFGQQLPDRSIGRRADGGWSLNLPTFGQPNISAPVGDPFALRINEWLARHQNLAGSDFIEIYNSDSRPVELGGLYLANAPASPTQSPLAPLSFIGAKGLAVYFADGDGSRPDHVNFTLAPDAGFIGLSVADGVPIDRIVYGPQGEDIPEGRSPDGGGLIRFLPAPTPGAANPDSIPGGTGGTNIVVVDLPLVAITNTWSYWQNGGLDISWRESQYDDSHWTSGRALLYVESASLPAAKNTLLTLGQNTYYFRTHFQLNTNTPGLRLTLQTIVDDGAIFWLNGHELKRLGMDPGTATFATTANRTVGNAAFEGPFDSGSTDLRLGDNVLAVEVHQSGSGSTDIVFGASLEAFYNVTNIVVGPTNAAPFSTVINEILADNRSQLEADGTNPDWLELYNFGADNQDLSGFSVTDDLPAGRKFTFPSGTVLGSQKLLRLLCDGSRPASSTNTGFGLGRTGGGLYLISSTAKGGQVMDSIVYGLQARDLALGRFPDGANHWGPTAPTPGSPNQVVALATTSLVRINEWLADNSTGEDWLELYNPAPEPVVLTGFHLSSDPTQPTAYTFPPHSYLGTGLGAWVQLDARGSLHPPDASQLNFKLNKGGDEIIFSGPAGDQIDAIAFGPLSTDVSEGRLPDGSGPIIKFFTLPSPGTRNTVDADRDGMADDWELTNGFSPENLSDALRDDDVDGIANQKEYIAGTNPHDPTSSLRVKVARDPAGDVVLYFTVPAEHRYLLQGTGELTGEWQTLIDTRNVAVAREVQSTDAGATMGSQRFYRLLVRR